MKTSFVLIFSLLCLSVRAQDFELVRSVAVTSVKNQFDTGACWAFAALSFFESEAILKGAPHSLDLSEKWVFSHGFSLKAKRYLMMEGNMRFSQGGSVADVLSLVERHGLLPERMLKGFAEDSAYDNMTIRAKDYVDQIIRDNAYSSPWEDDYNLILEEFLGKRPTRIDAKAYFETLGLNLDDYINITSFTHHPFYSYFVLEVPDNWNFNLYYNLPLDEMMQVIDDAIMEGHSLVWTTDITEGGFLSNGLAGTHIKDVNQQQRQEAFINKATTDDHAMHLFGIAKDEDGEKFYMVKNSWGEQGDYGGIWYVSEDYVRYKTISLMVNKSSLNKK